MLLSITTAWVYAARRLLFFFFRRLGSTAHASLMHAYNTWSLQKLSSCKAKMPWFLGRWNHIQMNTPFAVDQHLRLLNVFGKGRSARLTRDQQFTSERFEWIKNHVMLCFAKELAINRGYRLFTLIKASKKRHRIFRRDRGPSRIPARTPNVCATREERNMFLLFTNVSVRVRLSKTLWETS